MDGKDLYDLFMSGSELPEIAEVPQEDGRMLGDQELGEVVTLGNRQYIVLEHTNDGYTAVITKEFAHCMAFGENADYSRSKIRQWLNREFYNELVEAVGKDNILEHTVDLTADDGTGEVSVADFVSILTTQRYRKYRRFLPGYGQWWWTATRLNADDTEYAWDVCSVSSRGVLFWCRSDDDLGVRPFCFLRSSVFVD